MKIKCFGSLTDIVGDEVNISSPISSISDLKKEAFNLYPKLKESRFLIAVNHEITHDENQKINKEDEIAFLPPYAGG